MEAELQKIKNEDLILKDTAFGIYKKKGVNDVFAIILVTLQTTKQALLHSLSGVGKNNF